MKLMHTSIIVLTTTLLASCGNTPPLISPIKADIAQINAIKAEKDKADVKSAFQPAYRQHTATKLPSWTVVALGTVVILGVVYGVYRLGDYCLKRGVVEGQDVGKKLANDNSTSIIAGLNQQIQQKDTQIQQDNQQIQQLQANNWRLQASNQQLQPQIQQLNADIEAIKKTFYDKGVNDGMATERRNHQHPHQKAIQDAYTEGVNKSKEVIHQHVLNNQQLQHQIEDLKGRLAVFLSPQAAQQQNDAINNAYRQGVAEGIRQAQQQYAQHQLPPQVPQAPGFNPVNPNTDPNYMDQSEWAQN